MDFPQSECGTDTGQDCRSGGHQPCGARQCLLKGCERWFQPQCPQARYCSPACQQAACRWRRWRASRQYRSSRHGQARRQAQSCRYRQRQRERREQARQAQAARGVDPPREGQRAAGIPEELPICACDRPGCYELFVRQPRSPQQHCCSAACRRALRRVRERERRWRARRRRGIPPRRHQVRGPP